MIKIDKKILINLKYKITVFLLAILVWFFVKTEDNYRYSMNVPLKVVNLGSDRIITNDVPRKVNVTFWGKGRSIFTLKLRRDITYVLDAAKVEDSTRIALDKNNILMLRKNELEVLNVVAPKFVEVKVEHLMPKKVPVTSQCEIQTIPGYTVIGEVKLLPDSVEIIGPNKELRTIHSIFTEKKIFKKIKNDFKKDVKLIFPKQKYITLNTQKVLMTGDIQKLMEKPFLEVPVKVINYPSDDNVIVLPSTLSLVLEGGAELLLNITKEDIKAYVDYNKIRQSHEKDHPAYIITPQGTRYRDVKPTRFKIVVVK